MLIGTFQSLTSLPLSFQSWQNCFTQNEIARLLLMVALQKNMRDHLCETAETIEHFIFTMPHNGQYVNFNTLIMQYYVYNWSITCFCVRDKEVMKIG